MTIIPLKSKGCYEINLTPNIDHRGYFMRTYDHKLFLKNEIELCWVQENHSMSAKKGTIRGLHFQFPPFAETKLVRCLRGEILDVFVDLRLNSQTFGKWESLILSEEKNNMVLISKGFAHGFCTLTDECEVIYKVDNYYSPEHEGGINSFDATLKIPWDVKDPLLSEKDKKLMTLQNFISHYKGIEI